LIYLIFLFFSCRVRNTSFSRDWSSDVCSSDLILWKFVVPLLKPAIATFALFSFISAWNDPYASTMYATKDQIKTIPFAITSISGGAGVVARVGTFAAASFLMIIPTIMVFIITQRMVLQTMAHSGMKE